MAAFVAGCYLPPVFELAEHALDAVSSSVTTLIISDDIVA